MATPASPPGSEATASPLARRIGDELDRARRSGPLSRITIPPCPEQLVRLRAALNGLDPDPARLSGIVASDAAMAATLLRNANSARHRVAGTPTVQTVGQALNRIGLRESDRILTEVMLRQAIPTRHPLLQRFWEQAAQRAAAMGFIARQLPGTTPELAQLFGLFCHVGVPVLLQRIPGYGGTLAEAAARKDRGLVATENANHRTDHAVVGALVARAWGVAPPVMVAIRLHHEVGQGNPDARVDPEGLTLAAMGALAERAMIVREGLEPDRETERALAPALRWLGITEHETADWHEGLQAELDRCELC
ncbi:MAG: HDOD domain-containing protein [Betaproteobacteria bacterium]